MCVCVYVCQCVFPALSGAGRWRGRIKLPRRASLVPAQARNQRCVCVCACTCVSVWVLLVTTTWLPPTPPPQLKPVPRPHTLSPGAQSSRSSSALARQTPVAEAPPLLDLEASDAPQAAPLSQMPHTTSAPSSNLSLLDDPTPPTTVVSGEVCLFRPLAAHAIIRRRQRLKQLS